MSDAPSTAAPPLPPGPAIVTGGGGGIGRAIAARLAADGYRTVILDVDDAVCEAARELLRAGGAEVGAIAVDLADPVAAGSAIKHVVSEVGVPAVLVNCAAVTGLPAKAPLLETGDDLLRHIVAVNLLAPFVLIRETARHMAARGSGVIVNIGSVAAHSAQLDASVYTMTKAGLVGLTKAAALELGAAGIRVVQVDPGDIQTEGSDELVDSANRGLVRSGLNRGPTLGRRGRAEDIAATVSFLCSPSASYISGSQVVVDGGYLCG